MNPRLIAIIAFSYLYVFFEIVIGRSQKRDRTVEKSSDKGSFWAIVLAISVGYALSFTFGAHRLGRIAPWNAFFTMGTILVIIGLIIRVSAILTLRKHFTYNVARIKDHRLIETGWYKLIRHPGYLGQLIIFLGIATSMSNWLSVLGMMLPVSAGFIYRISVEEKFMKEQMGQKYLDYRKRTWRLIPGLF